MAIARSGSAVEAVVELRGGLQPLTELHLFTADAAAVRDGLEAKVAQLPGFFSGAPVVICVDPALDSEALDFRVLAEIVRQQGMMPVAVRTDRQALRKLAEAAGLGVLAERRRPSRPDGRGDTPSGSAGRLIEGPVRSGQRIYARGGDLVVLSSVSPGAELLADGHIHVYGALRGRAIAGARGDDKARIFCQVLDAELIAIAGCYQTADDMDPQRRGGPARIRLDRSTLVIESG